MDTWVTIQVYDQQLDPDDIDRAIDAAVKQFSRVETTTSLYDSGSLVSRINREAATRPVGLDSMSRDLIEQALDISYRFKGAFDLTIAPLKRVWGFGYKDTLVVPDKEYIRRALDHVDHRLVRLDREGIRFLDDGVQIDLGGIAKGYAVDRAIDVLKHHDIQDAMVDAGGDLRTLASGLTAGKRNVYIRHPRNRSELWGRFPLDEGAVATSGDYERFFIQDSVRYHHILDPHTGYPARTTVSVTVVGPTAALCDALSTAFFVMHPNDALDIAEKMHGIEACIFVNRGYTLRARMTTGLAGCFERLVPSGN
jgi:thiamine biosynthesis lipoprotein